MSSQRALANHLRTKHGNSASSTSKTFTCGHCAVAFTQSKNLLRHIRTQHKMTSHYRCVSYPMYFGCPLMVDAHQQNLHSLESVHSNSQASSILDFTTSAISSRFQIHRLKMDHSAPVEPFNYLITQQANIIEYINSLLDCVPNMNQWRPFLIHQ